MLEKLTKEQENLISIIRQKWLDLFYEGEFKKEQAEQQIKWLYKFCDQKEPIIFHMDSLLGCQVLLNILQQNNKDNIGDNIWDNIEANIGDNIEANIEANIGDNIGANIRANIGANIRDNIIANIWNNYNNPCWYGNISDFGWCAFYDYFEQCGYKFNYDFNNFDNFKKLLESGIYEIYTFKNFAITCKKPKVYQNESNRLHSENEAAVVFEDGFSMYFWNGVNIPEKWILQKDLIVKEDILNESNAEKRRCLKEIIGTNKYAKLLDIEVIDKDFDQYGYSIKLWKTKEKDAIINENIYFLNVTCNSTNREYFICVPEEASKNVWMAKAWTFKNQKIQIRHGDIGLLNLKKEFNQPIFES